MKPQIYNLIKDGLFSPYNALRLAGWMIKKPLTGPFKVTIDITNRCDMNCVMCWYHSPYLPPAPQTIDMPPDRFAEIIHSLREIHTHSILICGEGEPLQHPNIKEIISIARKNKIHIELMSNGIYLNKEMIGFITENRVEKILISLHCASPHTFHKIRPEKDKRDFDRIVANLKSLKEANKSIRLYIINVISSLNYEEIGHLCELAEQLKADKLIFKPLEIHTYREELLHMKLNSQQKAKIKQILIEYAKKVKIPNNIHSYLNTTMPRRGPVSKKRCLIPYISSTIGIRGDVLGCVYAEHIPLGNIYKNKFEDIWAGKQYEIFRKGLLCPKNCLGKAVYPF